MKYLLHTVETTRLRFREINRTDFNFWLPFFQDPKSSQHWVRKWKKPEKECEEWYDKQFSRYEKNQGGMNALIDKSTGNLIGHCGLLVQTVDNITELEIAYSLLTSHWNKGYATEAAVQCKIHAFENSFAGSLISIISLPNIPSAKVAAKNGMTVDKQTVYSDNAVNIYRIHAHVYFGSR